MVRVGGIDRDPGHEPARASAACRSGGTTPSPACRRRSRSRTAARPASPPTASRRPTALARPRPRSCPAGRCRTRSRSGRRRSATQSPHGWSRNGSRVGRRGNRCRSAPASSPPLSSVRHTCCMPVNSRPGVCRVDLERRVERPVLGAQLQRVVGRQPGRRIVAVEVDLGRRVVVVVVADRRRRSGRSPTGRRRRRPTRTSGSAAAREASYDQVPLSCVPPKICAPGRSGPADSDWNWIVRRPSLIGVDRRSGPPASSISQSARSSGSQRVLGPVAVVVPGALRARRDWSWVVEVSIRVDAAVAADEGVSPLLAKTAARRSGWIPCRDVPVVGRVAEHGGHVLPVGDRRHRAARVRRADQRPAVRARRHARARRGRRP